MSTNKSDRKFAEMLQMMIAQAMTSTGTANRQSRKAFGIVDRLIRWSKLEDVQAAEVSGGEDGVGKGAHGTATAR